MGIIYINSQWVDNVANLGGHHGKGRPRGSPLHYDGANMNVISKHITCRGDPCGRPVQLCSPGANMFAMCKQRGEFWATARVAPTIFSNPAHHSCHLLAQRISSLLCRLCCPRVVWELERCRLRGNRGAKVRRICLFAGG